MSISDTLKLVRAGRLHEATRLIQEDLNGDWPRPASRPMKDVTPAPHRLQSPGAVDAAPPAAESAPSRSPRFSKRDGALPYHLYEPAEPVPTAPLIVMLHGCSQSAEDFAAGTQMNAAAEQIGAHVVWPEQLHAANSLGCWNWFEPAHQGRIGEAAQIAAIVREVADEVAPLARGIHVAGLSAGGAMAAILGTHYPDLFASVGIHSGLPAGAARDLSSAFSAMTSGGTAASALAVPAIVLHGTADRTVAPANGAAIVALGCVAPKPRQRVIQAGGREVTITRCMSEQGTPRAELWQIDGMGHAWSGGHSAGSFVDPTGPDATTEMLRFFAEVDGSFSV